MTAWRYSHCRPGRGKSGRYQVNTCP